jgi:hypothetical protein
MNCATVHIHTHTHHLYFLMHNGYCMHLMPEYKQTVRFAYQMLCMDCIIFSQ